MHIMKMQKNDNGELPHYHHYQRSIITEILVNQTGQLHCLDGPALTFTDGRQEWFINGYEVTSQINQWAIDRDIDLKNLTEEDKLIIKVEWANYRE